MGRLPLQFSGRNITWRLPFSLGAELDVSSNQSGITFPDAAYLVNNDKPFEIHRMIVRLTAKGTPATFSSPTILEPQPSTLEERVRLNILDFGKNEKITKTPTLVSTLIAFNTKAHDFEEPYTLVRSEGFSISMDTLDYPNAVILDATAQPEVVPVQFIRVEITFQGFLIVVGPPSETR